jgi:ferredoxin
MQAPIAVVSALLGAIAWWTTGDLLWVLGAVIMLANWPYTLLAIMPTNHQLEVTASGGDRDTRGRLIRWGHLHAVRSALGAAATAVYLIAAASAYQSILELAEACDVPVRWSCRTGVCHNCESGLVSGTVAYGPEPLDKPADGNLLVCCSQPIGDVVIDL